MFSLSNKKKLHVSSNYPQYPLLSEALKKRRSSWKMGIL